MKTVVTDGFAEKKDRQTSNKSKTGESRRRKVMGLRFLHKMKRWPPNFRRVHAIINRCWSSSGSGKFF
jgi:hypothetical protein